MVYLAKFLIVRMKTESSPGSRNMHLVLAKSDLENNGKEHLVGLASSILRACLQNTLTGVLHKLIELHLFTTLLCTFIALCRVFQFIVNLGLKTRKLHQHLKHLFIYLFIYLHVKKLNVIYKSSKQVQDRMQCTESYFNLMSVGEHNYLAV